VYLETVVNSSFSLTLPGFSFNVFRVSSTKLLALPPDCFFSLAPLLTDAVRFFPYVSFGLFRLPFSSDFPLQTM